MLQVCLKRIFLMMDNIFSDSKTRKMAVPENQHRIYREFKSYLF